MDRLRSASGFGSPCSGRRKRIDSGFRAPEVPCFQGRGASVTSHFLKPSLLRGLFLLRRPVLSVLHETLVYSGVGPGRTAGLETRVYISVSLCVRQHCVCPTAVVCVNCMACNSMFGKAIALCAFQFRVVYLECCRRRWGSMMLLQILSLASTYFSGLICFN